ncbi:unnamed protein product [Oppiella nova]|uniref:Uncharacterized protein n=1 Tax=Oppiella nova TaxID=334625 RepID=A0A7R9MUA0_9ACAR|nr:unnamed protein product [Oppiella nova]CAG2183467.1 unnamed protein product [Oppiella nova]
MFTKCVALELAPNGIRVNGINLGYVKTGEAVRPHPNKTKADELKEKLQNMCPFGRAGEPMDVTKAVLYLSFDDTSFVTGHNFAVDGGLQHVLSGIIG